MNEVECSVKRRNSNEDATRYSRTGVLQYDVTVLNRTVQQLGKYRYLPHGILDTSYVPCREKQTGRCTKYLPTTHRVYQISYRTTHGVPLYLPQGASTGFYVDQLYFSNPCLYLGVPETHLCLVIIIMSNLRKITRTFRTPLVGSVHISHSEQVDCG